MKITCFRVLRHLSDSSKVVVLERLSFKVGEFMRAVCVVCLFL